jgi:hypothetical protein
MKKEKSEKRSFSAGFGAEPRKCREKEEFPKAPSRALLPEGSAHCAFSFGFAEQSGSVAKKRESAFLQPQRKSLIGRRCGGGEMRVCEQFSAPSAFLKELQTEKQKCQSRARPVGREARLCDIFAFLFNCFKTSFCVAFCICEPMAKIQKQERASRVCHRGE